ncbi:MAG TPA: FAD-dependent oxidoreductase [Candidatus Ozemobacteraceae bacterium]|nr:FAD-dependent oxidoreductase [Candidatus Ozemobacteraceae bacterium]
MTGSGQMAVIIGNGVAGAAAAVALRDSGYTGKILAVTAEPWPVYFRTRLPELISGGVTIERIVMTPVEKFAEKGIELRLGTRVESADPKARTIRLSGGETLGWDQLLLATGCDAFMPPIEGRECCTNLFTLRDAADAQAIHAAATGKKRAVCIGGGVLGLEAAFHLTKLGLAVELVEVAPRLMPRQLDAAGAAVLQKLLERQGFRFHLGAKVGCLGEGHLKLQNGEILDGDVHLVSAGVAPRLDLAKQLGVPCGRGVQVDAACSTGVEGVFAAGDGIEYQGRTWGTWLAARHWGNRAGQSMAGKASPLTMPPESFRLKLTGVDLLSVGEMDLEGALAARGEAVAHVIASKIDEGIYHKVVERDGVVVGAILLGACTAGRAIEKAVAEVRSWKELATEIGVAC